MFGKKKEKKEKIKEEKRKDKSAKEHKKKSKTPDSTPEGSQLGSTNGYARDQMGEAIYIQKPNSVIEGYDSASGPKYGAKNLKLVNEKDGKKDKKGDKGRGDKKDKGKGGILKPSKKDVPAYNGQGMAMFDHQQAMAPPPTNPGQVTFAGPDNRVHQSVVKISQTSPTKPPDILPNNYQTNMPNGQSPNGYRPAMYAQQVNGTAQPLIHQPNVRMTSPYAQAPATSQFANVPRMQQPIGGARVGVPGPMPNMPNGVMPMGQDPRALYALSAPNIAYNGHAPIRLTNSDPNTPMSAAENVKHLQISQGMAGTRHVTSIDVIGKSNQTATPLYGYARDRSPSPFGYRDRSTSPSSLEQHAPIASAQGGLPQNPTHAHNGYSPNTGLPVQHNKGPAPAPPIVLAELNVTENMVASQHNEAYAKFDRMVEKAREDEITYAQLLFDRQPLKTNTDKLKREKIANYTIEMDSDEENEMPLRKRGILKAPKKVEFNKDVDVTLFGTLSRHESLESLYNDRVPVRGAVPARHGYPTQKQYCPQPPPYASIMEERPLDDTDLYMYTMRRKRAPTVYVTRRGYEETMRKISRHGSLRNSGSRGRPSVRTVRVIPGTHVMW